MKDFFDAIVILIPDDEQDKVAEMLEQLGGVHGGFG